jgi:hypothetical protein
MLKDEKKTILCTPQMNKLLCNHVYIACQFVHKMTIYSGVNIFTTKISENKLFRMMV